ncbi:MAG: helix-turn-helix domain-containing protein [Planctomycetaceae bacterium]|nr:helix-turn-helix domain-containing protein [Planctomycetaceae bacterium]
MTQKSNTNNRVRELRISAGLTQAELAERAGISRTAVTAIEGKELAPSVVAALSLAKVLGTTVEILFTSESVSQHLTEWAWDTGDSKRLYWQAEVDGRNWLYPAESTPLLTPLPDGRFTGSESVASAFPASARQTLVLAGCDPAAGMLATEYGRATDYRLLALPRSSQEALTLIQEGKVHLAGLHYSTPEAPNQNVETVQDMLGSGFSLIRMASWEEGIVTSSNSRRRSVRGIVTSRLRWVGRETGSGARRCLDQLLEGRPAPRHVARNHRGVAEAVKSGWADAGICVQLTGVEAGLRFFRVQTEYFDLCCKTTFLDDPRLRELIRVLQSSSYRELVSSLPGYSVTGTGEVVTIQE